MSPELIVALALAVMALFSGLARSFQIVQEARGRVDRLVKARSSQVDRIRKAARTSLMLKRSIREAEKRKAATETEVEQAAASMQAASAIDHRLYVLDDRRTKADLSWIATIVHPGFDQSINHNALPEAVESWRKGRRFLVFALDNAKAREKIIARHPDRQGYQLVSIELQPPPKSKARTL
ncbi:MAG: hypothetical protein WCO00_15520 [Rhodospirillaceae bacterium]